MTTRVVLGLALLATLTCGARTEAEERRPTPKPVNELSLLKIENARLRQILLERDLRALTATVQQLVQEAAKTDAVSTEVYMMDLEKRQWVPITIETPVTPKEKTP